jgi:hypothetical protein
MATSSTDHLAVISHLSHRAIVDSVRELASLDRLTLALRMALKYGADIDTLSAESGLTPAEIRHRVNRPLAVLDDELDALAGVV